MEYHNVDKAEAEGNCALKISQSFSGMHAKFFRKHCLFPEVSTFIPNTEKNTGEANSKIRPVYRMIIGFIDFSISFQKSW